MTHSSRRRRRFIGIGFVLAFALSTATIIYTGLNVRAPGSAGSSQGEAQRGSAATGQAAATAETENAASREATDDPETAGAPAPPP